MLKSFASPTCLAQDTGVANLVAELTVVKEELAVRYQKQLALQMKLQHTENELIKVNFPL